MCSSSHIKLYRQYMSSKSYHHQTSQPTTSYLFGLHGQFCNKNIRGNTNDTYFHVNLYDDNATAAAGATYWYWFDSFFEFKHRWTGSSYKCDPT